MESTKYAKGFFIICESWSKSVGAAVKDAPVLSLTPACMVFLPLLVLMLSLQVQLNTNPYQKKKKRLLC